MLRPVQRLVHPPSTQHADWPIKVVPSWRFFLATPSPALWGSFVVWLWHLAVARDIPSLYTAMVAAWQSLSPLGSRGASRCSLKCKVLASTHCALAVARLFAQIGSRRWPRWFQHTWKALPPEHRAGIMSCSFDWFLGLMRLVNGMGGTSAVSMFFHMLAHILARPT